MGTVRHKDSRTTHDRSQFVASNMKLKRSATNIRTLFVTLDVEGASIGTMRVCGGNSDKGLTARPLLM